MKKVVTITSRGEAQRLLCSGEVREMREDDKYLRFDAVDGIRWHSGERRGPATIDYGPWTYEIEVPDEAPRTVEKRRQMKRFGIGRDRGLGPGMEEFDDGNYVEFDVANKRIAALEVMLGEMTERLHYSTLYNVDEDRDPDFTRNSITMVNQARTLLKGCGE